jgi:ketosteroid isomerase-like protein
VRPPPASEPPGRRDLEVPDRVALRALVDAYALALDRLDVEGFASLWTDDGVLTIHEDGPGAEPTAEIRGRDRMHQPFSRLRTYRATIHVVGTHLAEGAPDGAVGTTYCQAHHLVEGDDGPPVDKVLTIRYRDGFRSEPEGWRFSHRRVEVLLRTHQQPEVLG